MRMLLPVLFLSLMPFGARGQQADSAANERRCQVVRTAVKMDCPAGWNILTENGRETVVANFRLGPEVTKDTRTGRGKATIAVSNMPSVYRKFAEWIYAAHKVAPDAVEKRIQITNRAGVAVPIVWMVPRDATGPLYSSYFFQVGETPVLVELAYRADDPSREAYISAAKAMIASAVAGR